ncbi:hypothetical protein G6F56_003639 [Rhizopus delemar]|uniref:Uncharacterized protein n=1 Tax=Rhizopus stolonifer TaxID=4846 RepID=A0A367KVY1_RHIST|nr:hypothetical protein G6F56_003639 [Rhizopus delemar]RCI06356.1 hypothetical protein CU098_013031 [Rhizopus stolonifer]
MPPDNTMAVVTTFGGLFLKEHSKLEKIKQTSDHDKSAFKLSLYKNSNVYRIVLNNPVKTSKVYLERWNRIDLKLVTEMGLPMMINEQSIPISCKLLQRNTKHGYIESENILIECRPAVTDSWNTEDIVYEQSNAYTGCFEYRVIAKKTEFDRDFFIIIQTEDHRSPQHSLPLCLGPFQLQDTPAIPDERLLWDDITHDVNTHRVLPLGDCYYLILKEMWDNGTPGKLWDSALVISHIITRLFKENKEFLSGLRIMDLSAGIGSLGLLISELCQVYRIPNPPTVVLTDIPEALPLIKHNLSLNDTQNIVRIKPLRWGQNRDIERVCKRRSFDYIFVSDVLYNTEDFCSLIITFRLLCNTDHPTVLYLGYKPRGLKPFEEEFFFTNCAIYFDIKRLSLDEFEQDLLGKQGQTRNPIDQLLGFTGVQLYKLVVKKD